MDVATSLAIVSSATASVKDNAVGILGIIWPYLLIFGFLFFAWREIKKPTKGRV